MSSEPPRRSGSATAVSPDDPVTEVITGAGLTVDARVHECSQLAASAHRQRFRTRHADAPAVDRSTFLWALWRMDEAVRAALEQNSARLEDFETMLGITANPEPVSDPFQLSRELARALRASTADVPVTGTAVTPTMLGAAVLRDVAVDDGLLGDRLRRLGTDAGRVLDTLRRHLADQTGRDAVTGDDPLLPVRELTPQRFGVHLPAGADEPGPYVGRDVDVELDRLLSERTPVVAVVAPPWSGAIRTVYESLRRTRPGDRVLLVHELLDPAWTGVRLDTGYLDRAWGGDADVVWVRSLREFLDAAPVFAEWFGRRLSEPGSTLVGLLRPEDLGYVSKLGLLPTVVVEINGGLSPEEQSRARELYRGDPTSVSAVAAAEARQQAVVRANYAADSATAAGLLDADADDLDIRSDVDMLAKLIASKDVRPPLSIGLFGPWGSGKSFLMRQVQLRIGDLCGKSRQESDPSATGYLREIVAVEFNAWQYAHGTALWAALINRVFQQIQQKLGGDERYQKVLRDIAVKDVGVAHAQARLDAARVKVDQSRPAAQDRAIGEVVKDHEMPDDALSRLEKGLNLDAATSQMSDLRAEYDRLTTTSARVAEGWATASALRRMVFVGLLLVAAALVAVSVFRPGAIGQLGALVGVFASVVASIVQLLRPVNRALEQAAPILRADDADKQTLLRAQDDLDEATRDLAEAKASGLAGLYGFVSDRSSAAEYRRQLGMAPVIRDDLERLARLSKIDGGLPGIDRIVIFIDDLDRCPAAEVVRVLEAVNLLFGFELFVVVVAVDSRWLLRSLDRTFSEAFDAKDGAAPTPQHYLEKIIQIPFWLQPMQADGYERLVTSLAGAVDDSGRRAEPAEADGDVSPPFWLPADGGSPFHAADPGTEGSAVIEPVDEVSIPAPSAGEAPGEPVKQRREDLNPKAIRLTPEELDLMLTFHPLVGTPRAVKRFLNTYQLLRVSVEDVDTFLDDKDHEPVLLLLAMLTGTAPMSDEMVDDLRSMTEATFAEFLEHTQAEPADRDRSVAWKPVVSACTGLPTGTLTPQIIGTWLPKVARYSFHAVGR